MEHSITGLQECPQSCILCNNRKLSNYKHFFLAKFTIYSTNWAISKYVIRKHLCGAIIQWWFSYVYCTLLFSLSLVL
jgi:hypothetical protein